MKLNIRRGTQHIGGSIIEVSTPTTKIVLDAGAMLPPPTGESVQDTIAIEGLTYGVPMVQAVFVSHYHGDHCGLLPDVLPDIPVYTGYATRQVLDTIADFTHQPHLRMTDCFSDGVPVTVGDITVTPIPVSHSAYDAHGFLVESGGTRLLYTGDFRSARELCLGVGGKAVDVLLTEATNMTRFANGPATEEALAKQAAELLQQYTGTAFVLCSSTNIPRICALYDACKASNRTLVQDIYQAKLMETTGQPSALTCKDIQGAVYRYVDHGQSKEVLDEHIARFRGATALAKTPRLCYLLRGSSLPFMRRLHQEVPLKGSVMLYSFWSGYRNAPAVQKLLDFCKKAGVAVVTLHVSGHAFQEELMALVSTLRPRTVIPIHCEPDSRRIFGEEIPNCKLLDDNVEFEIP